MISLVLDSSGAASAALLDDGAVTPGGANPGGTRVVARWEQPRARKHAEQLAPALRALLADGPTPQQVIVGVGPAPFTGLRAGIAMGLGVSVGLGIPACGWYSHDGLALRIYERLGQAEPGATGPGDELLVATDARRKEVYWTSYSGLDRAGVPVAKAGPDVAKPADLAHRPGSADDGTVRVGRGFLLYPEVLGAPDYPADVDTEPLAADIGRAALRAQAAGRGLLPVTPLYLREPDAKPLHA